MGLFQLPNIQAALKILGIEKDVCVPTQYLKLQFSFISNYGNRVTKSKFLEVLTTFSISGYAIPGVILAVAFISLVSYLDDFVFINFKKMFIGSIFGLVLVYFVRFFALSSNGIKSGYLKINKSIDESAYL